MNVEKIPELVKHVDIGAYVWMNKACSGSKVVRGSDRSCLPKSTSANLLANIQYCAPRVVTCSSMPSETRFDWSAAQENRKLSSSTYSVYVGPSAPFCNVVFIIRVHGVSYFDHCGRSCLAA